MHIRKLEVWEWLNKKYQVTTNDGTMLHMEADDLVCLIRDLEQMKLTKTIMCVHWIGISEEWGLMFYGSLPYQLHTAYHIYHFSYDWWYAYKFRFKDARDRKNPYISRKTVLWNKPINPTRRTILALRTAYINCMYHVHHNTRNTTTSSTHDHLNKPERYLVYE